MDRVVVGINFEVQVSRLSNTDSRPILNFIATVNFVLPFFSAVGTTASSRRFQPAVHATKISRSPEWDDSGFQRLSIPNCCHPYRGLVFFVFNSHGSRRGLPAVTPAGAKVRALELLLKRRLTIPIPINPDSNLDSATNHLAVKSEATRPCRSTTRN